MKAALSIRRCNTLADVRREIDRLDRRIVRLLSERAGYVGEAARVKEKASQIVDRARIEAVVARAADRATALGADGETIARIYRAMIDAFIAFERRAFTKKKTRKTAKIISMKRSARTKR
ncbi:MAG TPA: chorismate mutase [Alphaproteobacteria bacterium]|jgi:isochorismate pyruvate lyase|nr:chorismate mutase [Alphaproteobacteria bacterium]